MTTTNTERKPTRTEQMIRAYSVDYRGFTIRVKGDFGDSPFLIDGLPCAWGYIAVRDGCNAMPGATWFQTVKQAKAAIDALITAEATHFKPADQAAEFWRIVRGENADTPTSHLRNALQVSTLLAAELPKMIGNPGYQDEAAQSLAAIDARIRAALEQLEGKSR